MTSLGKPYQHYVSKRPRKDLPLPFACFTCRKSFKRPTQRGVTQRPCPVCGGPALQLGRYFQPPSQTKRKEWQVIEYLATHGYAFDRHADDTGRPVRIPKTLAAAQGFLNELQKGEC
jgi:hypothetical protein